LPNVTNTGENTFGYLVRDTSIEGSHLSSSKWRVLHMSFYFEELGNVEDFQIDALSFYEYILSYQKPHADFDSSNVSMCNLDTSMFNHFNISRLDKNLRGISGQFDLFTGYQYLDTTHTESD
jgi:hypothetical protein